MRNKKRSSRRLTESILDNAVRSFAVESFNFILGQMGSYQEDWKEKYCDSINKDHFGEVGPQSLGDQLIFWFSELNKKLRVAGWL